MWPLCMVWNADLISAIVLTLSIIVIFAITVSIINYFIRDLHIPIRDASKHHSWCNIKLLSKTCYCSVCSALMVTGKGVYCDCCGVCADSRCIKKADRKLTCKAITLPSSKEQFKHQWVKGNLSLGVSCEVCSEECGLEPGLVDLQCCWCQSAVHTQCYQYMLEVCDFGKFRQLIIPPYCIALSKSHSTVGGNLKLQSITPTDWRDWNPLIVLANRKSGNNDGGQILSMFRRFLNPAQVVDLADRPPERALEWCSLLGKIKSSVLVAGGDGSVGWVLNAIDKLKLDPSPAVAILPLGTGNDLSRVLGWGKEHKSDLDPALILEQIQAATEVKLDRWRIEVNPYRHLGIRRPKKQMFMYNYISIGVDAQVTLDFHLARESQFYIMGSRFINKLLYLGYGTQQAVERGCRDLDQRIEVYLDGKLVELPSIESVVVLNIPSWGAGVHLWEMGPEYGSYQSISDGKLEVLALYSSFHIAQLQMGLSQPYRVGQATHVQIKLKAQTAIQVDGEPWDQPPADIIITHYNQASVLKLHT